MLIMIDSSALRDFKVREGETRRHMLRITPQAERPYFDAGDAPRANDVVPNKDDLGSN